MMMNFAKSSSLPGAEPATRANAPSKHEKDSPEEIQKAASQFEAVLIGQLLQSARSEGGAGWMDTDESDPGSNLTEMSEQAFSSALASTGGLGLAKMITAGLVRSVAQTSH